MLASFWHHFIRIFAHSARAKTSSSWMFLGFIAFFKFCQRFSEWEFYHWICKFLQSCEGWIILSASVCESAHTLARACILFTVHVKNGTFFTKRRSFGQSGLLLKIMEAHREPPTLYGRWDDLSIISRCVLYFLVVVDVALASGSAKVQSDFYWSSDMIKASRKQWHLWSIRMDWKIKKTTICGKEKN